MKELSLNILDITQNSISARATLIYITLTEDTDGWLTLAITDDGCGMTEETLRTVMDPFYTTRTTRKVGMGVPLLKMAAEQGFRSVITTNGTLLKKRGEEIISAKPHKVSVSLHSFEENDNAAQLKYLEEVCSFAEEASAAGIIVVFRLWNRGCDDGHNAVTEEFLRKRLDGEWAENTRGYRIRKKLFLEWGDRFEWPDKDADIQEGETFCYGLQDHFGILCDGTVVPCCMDSDGVIALGNVFQQDLSDILGSDRAKAMTEGFACKKATEELCRRCSYAKRFV